MCTVKKDFNIPESPLDDSPKPTSTDYDQLNRKQSQMLLDMIYATANKKRCMEVGLKKPLNPCPLKSFLHPDTPLPCDKLNKQVDNGAIWQKLNKMKCTIEDMQRSIAQLPQQIVAAFLEKQHCFAIQNQIETDEDFDKLSVVSEEGFASSLSSRRSLSTCSSDIEVLNYCTSAQRQICAAGASNTASSPNAPIAIDISKEILHLSKAISMIEIPSSYTTSAASTPMEQVPEDTKQAVANLFSHWEQRYQTSQNEMDRPSSSTPPIGNIRCRPQENCHQMKTFPSFEVPKILPYSSTIDLNVWLK